MTALIDIDEVRKTFGLTKGQFAFYCGVHRNTMYARPQSPKIQEKARDLLRVLEAVKSLGVEDDVFWIMSTFIPRHDYKTPFELIKEGKVDEVIRYIQKLTK